LAWMSALASVAFAHWWAADHTVAATAPAATSTAGTANCRRFFHLWQAARVTLAELAGGVGTGIGGGAQGSENFYLLGDDGNGSEAASPHGVSKQTGGDVLEPLKAWEAVAACLAEVRKGTATPWELPLDVVSFVHPRDAF
jgi:hypothetical protein